MRTRLVTLRVESVAQTRTIFVTSAPHLLLFCSHSNCLARGWLFVWALGDGHPKIDPSALWGVIFSKLFSLLYQQLRRRRHRRAQQPSLALAAAAAAATYGPMRPRGQPLPEAR